MQLNFTNLFNFDNEVIEIDTRISLDDFNTAPTNHSKTVLW
jgi:hypothetical protein